MAAELRFRLAEPLQLVARRNEKSGVELSRFVAKQVRSGWCGATWQPPGVRTPSVREGLFALWSEGSAPLCLPRAAISSRQLCVCPALPGPRAAGGS